MDPKLVFILKFVMYIQPGYQDASRFYKRNERNCNQLLRKPHYNDEKVAGHLWRDFYSWNVFSMTCQTTEFLKPTPKKIRHYEREMSDYVKNKIQWTEAAMLAKNGRYEMLMFHDQGPIGSYLGIPNLDQFGEEYEDARDVFEPMKFAMKLVHGNKFLIMLDCSGGLGHIMVKANDTVAEAEILSVAKEVAIGKGYFGCVSFISH